MQNKTQTKHMVQNMTIIFMAGKNVLGWNSMSTRINLAVPGKGQDTEGQPSFDVCYISESP